MLVEALSSLTQDQKSWICSTGFGSILSFELKEYPPEISRFLLIAFEPNPPLLRLDVSTFHVTEQDVREILGLPIGEADVDFVLYVCS